jgi:hypothetical protein
MSALPGPGKASAELCHAAAFYQSGPCRFMAQMHLQTDGETVLKRKVQLVFESATLSLLTLVAVSYHRSIIYFIRKHRKGITATASRG